MPAYLTATKSNPRGTRPPAEPEMHSTNPIEIHAKPIVLPHREGLRVEDQLIALELPKHSCFVVTNCKGSIEMWSA